MKVFKIDTELIDFLSCKKGIIFLLGETDTGKTTFANNLIKKLVEKKKRVAFVDSDVGQSTIGPPTTIGLKIVNNEYDLINKSFDELYFVGSLSPRGHFLPMLIGTYKLSRLFLNEVEATVIDTTGLVHGNLGMVLKFHKIELVEPQYVILFERNKELKPYKDILKNNNKINTILLNVSKDIKERGYEQRRKYREDQFKKYFDNANIKTLDLRRISTFPIFNEFKYRAQKFNVLGLESGINNLLGIGIFLGFCGDFSIKVFTPLPEIEDINLVKLGYSKIDFIEG
jgi:polynucleotide 5'-hydroxyl-kinase GRC3/NOL9